MIFFTFESHLKKLLKFGRLLTELNHLASSSFFVLGQVQNTFKTIHAWISFTLQGRGPWLCAKVPYGNKKIFKSVHGGNTFAPDFSARTDTSSKAF